MICHAKPPKRNPPMVNTPRPASAGGISFWGALLLILVTLKLCGVISWSWWLVLLPAWVPAIIFALCCLVIGVL